MSLPTPLLPRWLVRAVAALGVGQGLQYLLNPGYPSTQPVFSLLTNTWGQTGWRVLGLVLVLACGSLFVLPAAREWLGHLGAALVYLVLVAAELPRGVVSFVLLICATPHLVCSWKGLGSAVPHKEAE